MQVSSAGATRAANAAANTRTASHRRAIGITSAAKPSRGPRWKAMRRSARGDAERRLGGGVLAEDEPRPEAQDQDRHEAQRRQAGRQHGGWHERAEQLHAEVGRPAHAGEPRRDARGHEEDRAARRLERYADGLGVVSQPLVLLAQAEEEV